VSKRTRNIILVVVLGCAIGFTSVFWDKGRHTATEAPAASRREPCIPKDIDIKSWQATIASKCSSESCPYIKIVGEAVNRCAHATGVRVRITAKDKNGEIVDVAERSLVNTRNISTGPYVFDLSDPFDYQKNMATFELEVIETRQWK